MIKITFPDGSIREFSENITPLEIANGISSSLAKKCIIAKVNGELKDLTYPINEDASIELVTASTEDVASLLQEVFNHSCAHLLAMAIKELYPNAMFGVGPAIEEGFYYDMDLGSVKLTEEDLPKIEKKMVALVASGAEIKRLVVSKAEALELFKEDIYKQELINELPEEETITVYEQGKFRDLCRGPHVSSTKWLKNFKLLSVSGAYWRGDAKKAQLQRVYGTCFAKEEDLKQHLINLEERNKIIKIKINVDKKNAYRIKDKYPQEYNKLIALLNHPTLGAKVNTIALPVDVPVPDWVLEFVDIQSIVSDSLKNFPLESIGLKRLDNDSANYTNIIQL